MSNYTIYDASKFTYPKSPELTNIDKWSKWMTKIVAFPFVCLSDLSNALLGESIGQIVLMQERRPYSLSKIPYKRDNITCNNFKINTNDTSIDGMEIQHISQQNLPLNQQAYVVHYLGNATCYEDCVDDVADEVRTSQVNSISFNYPKVQDSTGPLKSQHDLINAGILPVQMLIDRGIPSKNILLKGHSLGGSVATSVGEYYLDRREKLYVFSDRSLSSTSDLVIGQLRWLGNINGDYQDTIPGKIISYITYIPIKSFLKLTKWDMNVTNAYSKLSDAGLMASTEIHPKKNIPGYHRDGVITPFAKLPVKKKANHKKLQVTNADDSPNQHVGLIAHNSPLYYLKDREGNSGFSFFHKFTNDTIKTNATVNNENIQANALSM